MRRQLAELDIVDLSKDVTPFLTEQQGAEVVVKALGEALRFFEKRDEMNGAVHTGSPTRWSPITELVREAFDVASERPVLAEPEQLTLDQTQRMAWATAEDRGWHSHDASTPDARDLLFGQRIALVHNEVGEALQAFRKHGLNVWYTNDTAQIKECLDRSGYNLLDTHEENGETSCLVELRDNPGAHTWIPLPTLAEHFGYLPKPEGVAVELADVVIRACEIMENLRKQLEADGEAHLADQYVMDTRVIEKNAYNLTRPKREPNQPL